MTASVRTWVHGFVAVGLLVASTLMPAVAAGLAYHANAQTDMGTSTAALPMQFMVSHSNRPHA